MSKIVKVIQEKNCWFLFSGRSV